MSKESALEKAKELLKAARDNPEQFQELSKKYMGFKAVESKAKESGARDPGAVAAAAGRKKYGKEAFQHAAATGHKMGKTEENQRKADLRDGKIKKNDAAGAPQGGEVSSEKKPAQPTAEMQKDAMPTDVPQGGEVSSEKKPAQPTAEMQKDAMHPAPVKKDDQPHPAGSPPAEAHNVAEGDESLHHAMKILDTPDKQKSMLAHLRTLHESSQQRSPQNRQAGGVPPKAPNAPMNKVDMPGTSVAGAGNAGPLAMSEVLSTAKSLLKVAKEDPDRFAQIRKTSEMGLAMAQPPMAGAKPPAAPKPAAAMPKMPKPGAAPAMKCMTKDEIKEDMKQDWKPKHWKKKDC